MRRIGFRVERRNCGFLGDRFFGSSRLLGSSFGGFTLAGLSVQRNGSYQEEKNKSEGKKTMFFQGNR
jgi:hypothetical protein